MAATDSFVGVAGSGPRDILIAANVEAQQSARPSIARVIYTDTRTFHDRKAGGIAVISDVEIIARQIVAVQAPVDAQCAAKQPRTFRARFDIPDRLERTKQHGRRGALRLRDDVHAMVHAVDEIDVSVARRSEHGPRAWRESPGRVCGEVMRSEISLGLHDTPGPLHPLIA